MSWKNKFFVSCGFFMVFASSFLKVRQFFCVVEKRAFRTLLFLSQFFYHSFESAVIFLCCGNRGISSLNFSIIPYPQVHTILTQF